MPSWPRRWSCSPAGAPHWLHRQALVNMEHSFKTSPLYHPPGTARQTPASPAWRAAKNGITYRRSALQHSGFLFNIFWPSCRHVATDRLWTQQSHRVGHLARWTDRRVTVGNFRYCWLRPPCSSWCCNRRRRHRMARCPALIKCQLDSAACKAHQRSAQQAQWSSRCRNRYRTFGGAWKPCRFAL